MKKKAQPEEGVFIDGERSSYIGILIEVGGNKLKNFIEQERIGHSLKDTYLKQELGEYLDAQQIRKLTNIKTARLVSLAKKGKIQGTQLKGKWYYNVESVKQAIKNGLV